MTEDEMVRWHHQLDGHEFEQTLGDGEGQGSLVCYRESWGHKELDPAEQLNSNNVHWGYWPIIFFFFIVSLSSFGITGITRYWPCKMS